MPNRESEYSEIENIEMELDTSTLDTALKSLGEALRQVSNTTKRPIFDEIIDKHFSVFRVKLNKDKIFNDMENNSLKLWHGSDYILEDLAE